MNACRHQSLEAPNVWVTSLGKDAESMSRCRGAPCGNTWHDAVLLESELFLSMCTAGSVCFFGRCAKILGSWVLVLRYHILCFNISAPCCK